MVGKEKLDGKKTPIVYESIYPMDKDNKIDEKDDSFPIKNQSTVGDNDGDNSDVIMNGYGITIYLDLEKM